MLAQANSFYCEQLSYSEQLKQGGTFVIPDQLVDKFCASVRIYIVHPNQIARLGERRRMVLRLTKPTAYRYNSDQYRRYNEVLDVCLDA